MATRTIKLMGKAYSTSGDVSLVVNFNNAEVFNGTVTTENTSAPLKGDTGVELASWTVDTAITGSIPLSITVSGGDFQFNDLIGNYTGFVIQETTPGTSDVVNGEYVFTENLETYFSALNNNTELSDGKDNVSFSEVDGAPQQRQVVDTAEVGDWVYTIKDGVTFSCNFVIDASLNVLTLPTPA